MSLCNYIINTNNLISLAKLKGYLPLSVHRLLLKTAYKVNNGYEFVFQDFSNKEIVKSKSIHRFTITAKDLKQTCVIDEFNIPLGLLVHYIAKNRETKYTILPDNLVVTLSLPDPQNLVHLQNKVCISLFSSSVYSREDHYFSLNELTGLKKAWYKIKAHYLPSNETAWIKYNGRSYEFVKLAHGGEDAFIEFGEVSLSKVDVDIESIEDELDLIWENLSNHERALAITICSDNIKGSYCIPSKSLKDELKKEYSILI